MGRKKVLTDKQVKEHDKQYRLQNKEKLREIARQYRLRNKETLRQRQQKDIRENPEKYKLRRARQRAKSPMSYKLLSIRDRAKKRNLACDLTSEYLQSIWTGICPVFNTKIEIGQAVQWGRENFNSVNLASLDRIDATKGYIQGNVQWVSNLANLMKNCASPDQLVAFAKRILQT